MDFFLTADGNLKKTVFILPHSTRVRKKTKWHQMLKEGMVDSTV
jgi:hypothetical protein